MIVLTGYYAYLMPFLYFHYEFYSYIYTSFSVHLVSCFIAPDLLSCSYAIFQQEEEEAKKQKKLNSSLAPLSPVVETIDEASIGSDPLPASVALAPPTMCAPLASASTEDAAFAALDAALHALLTYMAVAAYQLSPLPPLLPPVVSASTPFLSMMFGSLTICLLFCVFYPSATNCGL